MTSGAETGIERKVRVTLEHLGYDIRVQPQVGPWVVDFAVGSLIIEADGDYWHKLRPEVDARKTADLEARGFTVWRLRETEINADRFDALLERRLADYEKAHGELDRRIQQAEKAA